MKNLAFVIVLCLLSLIFGLAAREMYNNYRASGGLTDESRRDNLLMPQKDSKPWTEWVAKYGDNADSWQLFTIGFHSRYLGEMNKRLTVLEKAHDSNEPNSPAR